jgi:hypothetical protein
MDQIRILVFSSLTFRAPLKNQFSKESFSAYIFLKVHTSFFKDKKSKRSHKTIRIKVFLTILLDNRRMIEGSRSGSGAESVLIPLTNESGSGRPENMWIRWIPIRIRIWNIALPSHFSFYSVGAGSGFRMAILMRIREDSDPEHCFIHFLPPLQKRKKNLPCLW